MVEILKCLHTATVALQKRDLILSECLLHWKQVVFELDKKEKPKSDYLILRQKHLLMNEDFVAVDYRQRRSSFPPNPPIGGGPGQLWRPKLV